MKDFRVEMIAYNNHIMERMKRLGFVHGELPSIQKLAEKMGYGVDNPVKQRKLRALICLMQLPIEADGSWKPLVVELAAVLQCEPADIYPDKLKNQIPLGRSTVAYADCGEPLPWIVM